MIKTTYKLKAMPNICTTYYVPETEQDGHPYELMTEEREQPKLNNEIVKLYTLNSKQTYYYGKIQD